MKVLKFGGTSLGNRDRIEGAARLIRSASGNSRVIVVASAVGGVTNRLAALIEEAAGSEAHLTTELDSLEQQHLEVLANLPSAQRKPAARAVSRIVESLRLDLVALAGNPLERAEISERVLATGERLSVQLVAAALWALGCAARVVDASSIVVTDSAFGEAAVDFDATRRRCRRVLNGRDEAIHVVTGFIGGDEHGRTTTLGRGGSDYSAAVIGSVLDAELVEIWSDVDGVLSAPPRLVSSASTIPWLSYDEAAELSFFGAAVLHPKTVRPLADRRIPIRVRNTFAPKRRGTEISDRAGSSSRVVAVSAYEDVTVLRIGPSVAVDHTGALMVSRSSSDGETLVALPDHVASLGFGAPTRNDREDGSIVTLVGHGIALQPWVAGRALESLARRGITVRSFAAGSGPHTVALLVDRTDLSAALSIIHDALMLDRQNQTPTTSRSRTGRKEVRHIPAA